jgi:hypothetical protein
LLQNGDVLVAGGINSSGTILSSAELYNRSTGTWELTSSMNYAREWSTATLLNNGQVVVAGGVGTGGVYLSNAELYSIAP